MTKYCDPAAKEFMLRGQFKIGTLKKFREIEDGKGVFADDEEGILNVFVDDPIVNYSGTIEGVHFSQANFRGAKHNIRVQRTIDGSAFCVGRGPYSKKTQEAFLFGVGDYPPTTDYTEFIELDLDALCFALGKAACYSYASEIQVLAKDIEYGERDKTLSQEQANFGLNSEAMEGEKFRIVFVKPVLFKPEDELRITLGPKRGSKAFHEIYTKDHPAKIQNLFKKSIIRDGSYR